MIQITERALSAFNREKQNFINEPIFRIEVTGVGWGGPSLKLVLEELKTYKNDSVEEISGIKVVYDKSLKPYVGNTVIDYSKIWLFGGFYLYGGRSGC